MSEQLESQKPERHFQAKYKYLADFSKHQFSPNLRKHYNDSFSKMSNSHERRSSIRNSHEKMSSFKKSHDRLDVGRYSPSCNTFNPRRETTQQEFSPYDERVDKEEERLNKELLEENGHLRTQLIQAGKTIQALKLDLAKRDGQNIEIKKINNENIRYYQGVIASMTDQIQIVLTKNKILENELAAVKVRLQEELRKQDEQLRFEDYRRRDENRRLDNMRRAEDGRRYEDQRRNTPQPATKRSVGKLLVRPSSNNQQDSLGTSKIKIQQDPEPVNQSTHDAAKNVQAKPVGEDNRKGEELICSIKSMQMKISGQQSASLKDLWKWLKGIGHTHSCLKRWKAKAAEASTYYTSDKLKDLVREACGYIE